MTEQQPAGLPRAMRVIALGAVCAGVAALAAGTFVLSYAGLHSVALQAGVSHRLARGYPLMFDVLLVVILAALLALRGAGWPSRILAWICLLALLAAAAGADALHAAGRRLPARPAAVTAAILPWALVLVAFVLLLAMLRQARLRRLAHAGPAGPSLRKLPPPEPPPLSRQGVVPGFPVQQPSAAGPLGPGAGPSGPGNGSRQPLAGGPNGPGTGPGQPLAGGPNGLGTGPGQVLASGPNDTLRLAVPRQVAPAAAADASDLPAVAAADHDLAIDSELAPDDPSSDEAALDPAYDPIPYPTDSPVGAGSVLGSLSPAPTVADAPARAATDAPAKVADPDMPIFHRMWSSPEPPSDPELTGGPEVTADSEVAADPEVAADSEVAGDPEVAGDLELAADDEQAADHQPAADHEPAVSSEAPASSESVGADDPATSSEPDTSGQPAASSAPVPAADESE
jgi:hypothetical protein